VTGRAGGGEAGAVRRAGLATALAAVRGRVVDGCRAAGRDPSAVTLVVVTKTHPVADLAHLAALGVRDVGESRDQEASAKHAALADAGLRWHFVGRLQTNKARSVAAYTDLLHSLDRSALVGPLGRGARAAGRTLECLVQVSLDGDPARGGAPVADVPALAAAVAAQEGLRLRGVMAVAPQGSDPARAFAVLPEVLARLRADHPGVDVVSAGMSGDLEAALQHGATHLRVGSAILGARPALQ
jgi:hypothetical protein